LTEKRLFEEKFKSLWMSYRVSFPLENAKKIHEYMRTERVSIFGGLTNIQYADEDSMFRVKVNEKRTGLRSTFECDVVINATSYSTDIKHSINPLLVNLLRRKLICPSEFGGIEMDYDSGNIIYPSGEVNRQISVIGSLATGTYFWANAMDVNARLAAGQAKRISGKIEARNSVTVRSLDTISFNTGRLPKSLKATEPPTNTRAFARDP